jgi:hypothetical protein
MLTYKAHHSVPVSAQTSDVHKAGYISSHVPKEDDRMPCRACGCRANTSVLSFVSCSTNPSPEVAFGHLPPCIVSGGYR